MSFWLFWKLSGASHTRNYVRNDVCHVFVFQEKKHFFMKKIFFRILHYSTALPESSPIMKIINFHEKPWFSLIFNDFHWFWSKIMKIDGFRCSWTSVGSGIRSEIVFVAFLNRWEKIIFHEKYFCALCTTLQICSGALKTINFLDISW